MLQGRDRWRDVAVPGATVQALLPPADLAGVTARMDPVPSVGEHTEAVLTALGHSPESLAKLRADGTI